MAMDVDDPRLAEPVSLLSPLTVLLDGEPKRVEVAPLNTGRRVRSDHRCIPSYRQCCQEPQCLPHVEKRGSVCRTLSAFGHLFLDGSRGVLGGNRQSGAHI